MSADRKSLTKNIGWSVVERLCSQLVYFAVSVILARLIVPEIYGVAMMVTMVINIFAIMLPSGFSSALIYRKDNDVLSYSTAFWATLAMTLTLYLVLYFAAPLIASYYAVPEITLFLRVSAFQLVLQGAQSIPFAYVSKEMLFRKNYIATLIGVVASAFVSIGLAITGMGVWALLLSTSVEVFVSTIVLCATTGFHVEFRFDARIAGEMVGYCWKLMGVDFLNAFYSNLNSLIIGKLFKSSDVAFYNRAYNLPQMLLGSVTTAVSKVLFPVFSQKQSGSEVCSMLRQSIRSMNYIVFPLLSGLIATGSGVIALLYTEQWMGTVPYLYIMCLVWAFQPVQICVIQAFKAIGETGVFLRLEIYKKIIGLIVILGSVALIGDPIALAMALLINQVLSVLINMPVVKERLGYSYRSQMKDIGASSMLAILMMCCVFIVGSTVDNLVLRIAVQVLVGVVVYACLSQLTHNETFQYLKAVINDAMRGRRLASKDLQSK